MLMGDNTRIGLIYVLPKTHPRLIQSPNSTLLHCALHFSPRLYACLDLDMPKCTSTLHFRPCSINHLNTARSLLQCFKTFVIWIQQLLKNKKKNAIYCIEENKKKDLIVHHVPTDPVTFTYSLPIKQDGDSPIAFVLWWEHHVFRRESRI